MKKQNRLKNCVFSISIMQSCFRKCRSHFSIFPWEFDSTVYTTEDKLF